MHIAPSFPTGQLVATPGALAHLHQLRLEPVKYLIRHAVGDWSDMDADDAEQNRLAATLGGRIFSSYVLPDGEHLWIITEADRSVTTVLLPEDY